VSKLKVLHIIAFILLVVGGLNWLLVAFGYNAVAYLGVTLAKIVYLLVGLAAILEIFTHKANCKACATMPKSTI
jgi:uncharacterized membrane protein YuzA (DUF378 family)